MNRFQIVDVTGQFNHAGTKATADISTIAEKLGFKRLNLQMRTMRNGYFGKARRQLGYYLDWNNCYSCIDNGATVILQHPFHYPQLTRERKLFDLKHKKKVKIISIVHDVEKLRTFRFNDYYKREFQVMIDVADVIIVHNTIMKRFFVNCGVDEGRIISLEIFDYLQNSGEDKRVTFEKAITIAGNLDVTKSGYIGQLDQLKDVKINLYGPNFSADMERTKNIKYYGSFPVDEIPNHLKSGFGLVWDGESIEGCEGSAGQYLKYNNPHKLSLYLSSGIPVVIWSGAAAAEFVKIHGVGICVESLRELGNIFKTLSEADYTFMSRNTSQLSMQLRTGIFTERAIKKAVSLVES